MKTREDLKFRNIQDSSSVFLLYPKISKQILAKILKTRIFTTAVLRSPQILHDYFEFWGKNSRVVQRPSGNTKSSSRSWKVLSIWSVPIAILSPMSPGTHLLDRCSQRGHTPSSHPIKKFRLARFGRIRTWWSLPTRTCEALLNLGLERNQSLRIPSQTPRIQTDNSQ